MLIIVVAVLAATGASVSLYAGGLLRLGNGTSTSGPQLPPGCARPAGGFLIIASNGGFNDSESHGAPVTPWPVLKVTKGSTVAITVCNTDIQAHGFQVTHYYDSSIVSVPPGQVLRVSFVAGQSGTFEIYCSILCTIHVYMQDGQLIVT